MRCVISTDEARVFLNRLVGKRISSVKLSKEGNIVIGFGKRYHLSNLVVEENELRVNSDTVSDYEIQIQSKASLWDTNLIHSNINKMPNSIDQTNLEANILDLTLKKIALMPGAALDLYIGCYVVRILYNLNDKESWRLYQPGTEAEQLIGCKSKHFKITRLQKRWSPNHVKERDVWHSICSDVGENYTEMASLNMLYALKDTEISYGLKSADINLFDIGFQQTIPTCNSLKEYSLHISCSFSISTTNRDQVCFFGDTRKDFFENYFSCLIGQKIEGIKLEDGNQLCIELKEYRIQIVPADDNIESWRLFMPFSNVPHLIAANTWINSTD